MPLVTVIKMGKDNPKVSSHLKRSAVKAVQNRAARRQLHSQMAEEASATSGLSNSDIAKAKVLGMMQEAQVPFLKDDAKPVCFARPDALGGVTMGLDLLVHDPGAMNQDLTVPWCGSNLEVQAVKKLLKSLYVPKQARRLKDDVLNSISKPNVLGMLMPDGSPNKDLKQLLSVHRGDHFLSEEIRQLSSETNLEIATAVLSILETVDDPLFKVVINSRGEKRVRLKMWSLEDVKTQMSKAIKTSSPGYPFNGFSWDEVVEGYSCVEHARIACEAQLADDAVLDGFLFIQQSRATGDAGAGKEGDGGGRQRLVLAAPNEEKVIGHILAYPFKAYIKAPPFSGQRGIQSVSRNVKSECQALIAELGERAQDYWIGDYDVSDWDAAQIDAVMRDDFFAICELVLDDEDIFTRKVLSVYQTQYFNSAFLTAFGQIKTEFLPSGSSITTVSAFLNHEKKIKLVDKLVTQDRGYPLFYKYGLQGDDNIAIYYKPDEAALARLEQVYTAYYCKLKNGINMTSLADNDAAAVFLNELILVRSDVESDTNCRFPRWNLFWAENYRDVSSPNIDRMLYDEVTRNVPHPTETELAMVSLVSKLDRFLAMPFYDTLVAWIRKRSKYPMRSWLAERVAPKSATVLRIAELEQKEGINLPEPSVRAMDRREEMWADAQELSEMFALLGLLSPICPETRATCKEIVSKARNSTAWKRAKTSMLNVGISFSDSEGDMDLNEGRELISLAFELGYGTKTQELVDEIIKSVNFSDDVISDIVDSPQEDKIKVPPRTLFRSLLALNEANPYQLRKLVAQGLLGAYESPAWNALHDEDKKRVITFFERSYGQTLDGVVSVDWLGG